MTPEEAGSYILRTHDFDDSLLKCYEHECLASKILYLLFDIIVLSNYK